MLAIKYLPIILMLTPCLSLSQTTLPTPTNFRTAYEKDTRGYGGVPGENYWQNAADYHIKIKFDPTTRLIQGNVEINYINNSPDTLNQVIFKLFPNLYKAGAMRKMPISPEDVTQGVEIKSIEMNKQPIVPKSLKTNGTNMALNNTQLLPGQKTTFKIAYAYQLNKNSFIRTGQVDSGAFVVAYFFPRIAVYDDIDGWDTYPYMGTEEFYNDYGNYTVEITVPDHYQVWATGELKNPEAVYDEKIINQINRAIQEDRIQDIITEIDIQRGHITQKNGWNTWEFEAENVSDFAFTASNHYIWKATSVIVDSITQRRTLVNAVYNPEHTNYTPVINYARTAVSLISDHFPGIPFPYPHITVFEGLDAMEYPMLVNNLPFEKEDAVMLTMHEIFHSIFPFYVGTNETKYSFMDEGWATFTEFMLYPFFDAPYPNQYDINPLSSTAGTDYDVPVISLTPQLYGKARFAAKDLKPALAYLYVKEMLGEQQFKDALKFYISQWKGKHPTPNDFFYSFNQGAEADLNWFWKNWFYEKNIPDLAIDQVKQHGRKYTVVITRKGKAIVPIHLNILYQDGTRQIEKKDISCWANGDASITIRFKSDKPIEKLILGTEYDADTNKENNTFSFLTIVAQE